MKKNWMKRLFGAALTLALLTSALTGCNSSQPAGSSEAGTKQLRMTQTNPAASSFGIACEEFADLISERTDGRYQVTVYHDGQLGDERDSIEAIQLGNIDFAVVNVSVLANFVPELSVFDLPYMIQGTEHADAVFLGEIGDQMMEWIDGIGIKGLGVWESGFRNLTNNTREVHSIDDVAGLRIRVMENEIHQKLWIALGADAVPMAWGEAYTALQQGALDGQENPLTVILSNNVQEVNKNLAMTEHIYSMVVPIMSQSLWDSLSGEDRAIFKKVADDMLVREREISREQNTQALKTLEDSGMAVTYPDKTGFIEATREIRESYGEKYLDIIQQIETLAKGSR